MATYFIGTEFDAFTPIGGFASETGGLGIDWYMRGAVQCYRDSAYDIFPREYTTAGAPIAVNNLWLHYRARTQDNPDRNDWVQFFGANDTPVVRMSAVDSNGTRISMQYWTGSAWVAIDTPSLRPNGYQATYDIHIKIGSAGKLEYYLEGVLVSSMSLDTSAFGNIQRVRLGASRYDYDGTWFGEVILANYSTIGHRVRRKYPTANGTYTDWTGDYTAVDEFAATDSDAIFTDTVGSRETYTGLTFSDSGMPIKAVAIAARVRADDEATVRGIRPMFVINGNDYVSPAPIAGTSGLKGSEWVFDKNPSNNSNWTIAAVNAAEFGVKSSDGGSN